MNKLITYTLASIFMLVCVTTDAQKLGYVNTQEIIQAMPEVKEANANIETYRNQLQKKGQDMVKALQTKYQGLERKQAQGEISPKQLEEEAQKLKQEELSIAEFEQNSQRQIIEKGEQLLNPIRERVQTAINEAAGENGYTYVFDLSTGFVLYADPTHDITPLVRTKLGL